MKILSNKKYNDLISKQFRGIFADVNDDNLLRENGLLYGENKELKQEIEKLNNMIERLNNQLQQKENIIKEVREYIEEHLEREYFDYDILEANTIYNRDLYKVLKILDKEVN